MVGFSSDLLRGHFVVIERPLAHESDLFGDDAVEDEFGIFGGNSGSASKEDCHVKNCQTIYKCSPWLMLLGWLRLSGANNENGENAAGVGFVGQGNWKNAKLVRCHR